MLNAAREYIRRYEYFHPKLPARPRRGPHPGPAGSARAAASATRPKCTT